MIARTVARVSSAWALGCRVVCKCTKAWLVCLRAPSGAVAAWSRIATERSVVVNGTAETNVNESGAAECAACSNAWPIVSTCVVVGFLEVCDIVYVVEVDWEWCELVRVMHNSVLWLIARGLQLEPKTFGL